MQFVGQQSVMKIILGRLEQLNKQIDKLHSRVGLLAPPRRESLTSLWAERLREAGVEILTDAGGATLDQAIWRISTSHTKLRLTRTGGFLTCSWRLWSTLWLISPSC